MKNKRVAIVHFWLVTMRGGEKVLETLCRMYPEADIFTHVYDPDAVTDTIRSHRVITSYIARLPFARRLYQLYLPFMPMALENLDLRGYDLVISSESGPAKGIICDPEATHICYCHSPMRYLWDQYREYTAGSSWLKRRLMAPLLHYLRMWDVTSAARVDAFAANSTFVAARIRKYWRRDAVIIHPPVEIDSFQVSHAHNGFYLWFGQLVPYKRPDIAIEAFNQLGLPLLVAGDGAIGAELQKKAGKNIRFLGRVSDAEKVRLYQECKALVFPGVEDFGIVPLEAQACGKPVIAYGRGGARETVIDGKTGILFSQQTVEDMMHAIQSFEADPGRFDPSAIRTHAEAFGERRFVEQIKNLVQTAEEKNGAFHVQNQG